MLPKKGAESSGSTVIFVDEAGFYMLPCVVRTWSPIGETPALTTPCKYDHLSVAGALTVDGRVLTKVLDRSFTGEDCVDFLKHILRQVKGKVTVIWDGAKIHHGEAVKEYLRAGASARLRLIRLPAYAPEMTPPSRQAAGYLQGVCGLRAARENGRAALAPRKRRGKPRGINPRD